MTRRPKKGDDIYYHHRNGDTYPGVVLKRRDLRAEISYNGLRGDVTTWVSVHNLTLQQGD